MIEALIVVVLASVVVLTIAYGLQVSVTTDGQTNRKQRMGLALSTLTDGMRRVAFVTCNDPAVPGNGCDFGISDQVARVAAAYQAQLSGVVSGSDAVNRVTWKVDTVQFWQPITYTTSSNTTTTSIGSSGGGYGTTFDANASAQRVRIVVSINDESLTGYAIKRSGVGT